jgi:NAD(P)-dependent dehydrogenase (short-subunit alcohol dehydrogenase family)
MMSSGQVVAITGGARGIGFATARRLTELGAHVAIGDVDDVAVKEAAATLGLRCAPELDVTERDSFAAFLDEVETTLGPIDVLINNAGIMPIGPLLGESDALARRIFEINVLGVITGTKLALARMLPRRSGHIVNIASLAGEVCVPGIATYCASKHAVLGFTDAARIEHQGSGVNLSSVLPWFTNTELVAGTSGVRGIGNVEPEDIAEAIVATLRKPTPRVRVSKARGALVQAQRFVPHRLAERAMRALGAESMFLDGVDQGARRSYEQRAQGQ